MIIMGAMSELHRPLCYLHQIDGHTSAKICLYVSNQESLIACV